MESDTCSDIELPESADENLNLELSPVQDPDGQRIKSEDAEMYERRILKCIFKLERLKLRLQMAKALKLHYDQSPEVQEMSKFLQGLVDIAATLTPSRRSSFRLEVVQLLVKYQRDQYLMH